MFSTSSMLWKGYEKKVIEPILKIRSSRMTEKKHVTVPKDTRAYFCANCGAVALNANNICKVEGMGRKSDWCGMKGSKPPKHCHNKVNNERWQCRNCGLTSVNSELLCEPEKLDLSQ
jgi:predicted RNA-binding Zn-ribbon protein involved in translation (DUF1610 family)